MTDEERREPGPARGKGTPRAQARAAGTEPVTWYERRRAKIAAEIAKNRRGEYKVPTWVLVAALVAIAGVWVAVIIFG